MTMLLHVKARTYTLSRLFANWQNSLGIIMLGKHGSQLKVIMSDCKNTFKATNKRTKMMVLRVAWTLMYH